MDAPDGSIGIVVDVHAVHFTRNVFAAWMNYYSCLGTAMPPQEAMQLWLPDAGPVRLDGPSDVLAAGGPNPAARRERRRRRTR